MPQCPQRTCLRRLPFKKLPCAAVKSTRHSSGSKDPMRPRATCATSRGASARPPRRCLRGPATPSARPHAPSQALRACDVKMHSIDLRGLRRAAGVPDAHVELVRVQLQQRLGTPPYRSRGSLGQVSAQTLAAAAVASVAAAVSASAAALSAAACFSEPDLYSYLCRVSVVSCVERTPTSRPNRHLGLSGSRDGLPK